MLSFGNVHRSRASFVIVCHMINPTAHEIASHELSIVGFEQFSESLNAGDAGSKPQLIVVRVESNRHSVVN